jgi:hypothetical protein
MSLFWGCWGVGRLSLAGRDLLMYIPDSIKKGIVSINIMTSEVTTSEKGPRFMEGPLGFENSLFLAIL